VRCDVAQPALSVAMDERTPPPAEVEAHAAECDACAAFRAGAWRLRGAVRLEVAPPVPDLLPGIMARVRAASVGHRRGQGVWTRRRRAAVPRPTPTTGGAKRRAVALALVAGLVVGFVVTAGLFPRSTTDTRALAADIPRELVRAGIGLDGYRATFDVTELNWTRAVPRRTFVADLAFRAPESFRVQVRDTTGYPSPAWPRNDLLLQTDGRTWRVTGPDPCPSAALPACPRATAVVRITRNRPPFDPQSPMPTDVIVPMTTLAALDKVEVVGLDVAGRRDAVRVQLAYEDARPLFQYLQFLGSWRPFFPQDRVVVSLDRRTWFPLRYEVFPATGSDRQLWAAQHALPAEPPTSPVFAAVVRHLSTTRPPAGSFTPPPAGGRNDGFTDDPRGDASWPSELSGLPLWRSGRFAPTPARPFGESVAAYARGLAWITVIRVTGWSQERLFGGGPFAEPVVLRPAGEGFYEPASFQQPRRLSLHTRQGELLLATNLPRAALLTAARDLHATTETVPRSWRIHRWAGGVVREGLTPGQAVADAPFPVLVPATLPSGYRAMSAQTVHGRSGDGVAIAFRRPAAEMDGVGLLLYQATGQTLPPPNSADAEAVMVGHSVARWSPDEHLLEWLDGDVYRSLTGPAFSLGELVRIAGSLRPATATEGEA
jgi:hypothetical protein